MTTSSRNYNIIALRGGDVDDMEYVETFGLDPQAAYTPRINDDMLDLVMKQNIDGGMAVKEAEAIKRREAHNIKRLLAKS